MSSAPATRPFTGADLARHDGDRGPAYVAYQRVVYDVSSSPEWRHGLHRNLHWAGQDLTPELAEAPHGTETLQRFPIVGWLLADDAGAPS